MLLLAAGDGRQGHLHSCERRQCQRLDIAATMLHPTGAAAACTVVTATNGCAGEQGVMQLMSVCESSTGFCEALPRVLPDISEPAANDLATQHYQPLYEAMDRQSPCC